MSIEKVMEFRTVPEDKQQEPVQITLGETLDQLYQGKGVRVTFPQGTPIAEISAWFKDFQLMTENKFGMKVGALSYAIGEEKLTGLQLYRSDWEGEE